MTELVPGLSRADFAGLPPLAPFGAHGEAPAGLPLRLSLSKGLQSWPVLDASGVRIASIHGLLLEGWLGAGLAIADGALQVNRAIATADDFERHVLRGLNGSFVAETLGGDLGRRLYLDCGGTLPIVYCAEARHLGGSADQLLDDDEYQGRFLSDRFRRLMAAEGTSGWIPGTLTAHRGVSRLLLNHYLDLDDFTQHRFWPHAELLSAPLLPLEEAAAIVARQMAGFSAAAIARYRISIALTAGLDSRLVLASFPGSPGNLSAMTLTDGGVSFDQEMPPRLSAVKGIRHQSVPMLRANEMEIGRWDRMVGHALRSGNRELHPSLRAVEADVISTGLYGEPARCFLYANDWQQVNARAADPLNILARLKQPRDAGMEADIEAWLAPVVHLPRSTVLDLAYLELRMGSWAMGQHPVQNALHLPLLPFAQWSVQEAFLAIGLEARASETLFPRVGEMLWPEGMRVPINCYGDWRDHSGPLWKLMKHGNFETIRRFLRMKRAD